MNVPGKLHGVGIFLHKNRAVSPLEEMAHPARSGIQVVGVTRIEVMQDRVKITPRSFEQQMIVIGHQAEAVNSGSVTIGRRLQIAQKSPIIFFGPEDVSALIAAGSDVIEGIRILNP